MIMHSVMPNVDTGVKQIFHSRWFIVSKNSSFPDENMGII